MLTEEEQALISAVRDLARGPFTERAAAHDREGSFVADNVDDLRRLGAPGAFVPVQYGGKGFSAEAMVRLIEEIAYGDGSTAVALNMHYFGADFLLLAPTPPAIAVLEDIAANQACLCAPGSVASNGLDTRTSGFRAREDGDSIVVNGKSGFASMSEGAKYVFLGGRMEDPEGVPERLFLAMPPAATAGIRNLHNWDALGFRGTASHDIACEEVRLAKSEATIVPVTFLAQLTAAAAELPAEVRQGRARGALGILAIWLGLSQAALDFVVGYVQERYGVVPIRLPGLAPDAYRADEPWAQARIGEMAHWVYTGRLLLRTTTENLSTPYESPQAFTQTLTHTIYHLRRMTEEVALGAMKVCGAHAYVRGRPMERLYRDLTGCIVMAWKTDLLQQQLGLGALGRPYSVGGPGAAG